MINFPYTNFHRLNLDWILQTVEKLVDDVKKIPETITAIVDSRGYVTREEASAAAPVQSVNGETGAVNLTAADVGAKPASYEAPVQSVNGETGAVTIDIPAASTTNPVMDGTVAIGTATTYARADHRHPKDTSKANLASPTFTGTPKAPTAASGTNTTQIATTAFVQQEFSATDYQEIIDNTSFTWGEVIFRFHKWGKMVVLSVKILTTNGSISADTDLLPFTRFPAGYIPNNVDTYDYTGFMGRGGGGTAGFGTLRLTTSALKYSPYTTAAQGNNYQGSITYLVQ